MSNQDIDVRDIHTGDEFSQKYAEYRPVYTENIFQEIISFHRQSEKPEFDLALDVGCGTGQGTLALAKYFSRVLGVDVSKDQIQKAPNDVPNVTFRVSPGEDLTFLPSGSVDLVTIATALHWLDIDRFYSEVARILKPGGSLVVYGYASEHLEEPEAEKYMQHIQVNVCGKYFTSHGVLNKGGYDGISLPFAGWIRKDNLIMEHHWTVEQYVRFQSTISFIAMYIEEHHEHDLLQEIKDTLEMLLKNDEEPQQELKLKVTWPIFMLMGHKPMSNGIRA